MKSKHIFHFNNIKPPEPYLVHDKMSANPDDYKYNKHLHMPGVFGFCFYWKGRLE